jgi:paired amphipathic helix protein Sin3a
MLFKDADDLLVEFKEFLPTFIGGGMAPASVSRIASHTSTAPAPAPPSEHGTPQKSAAKRRKRDSGKDIANGSATNGNKAAAEPSRVRDPSAVIPSPKRRRAFPPHTQDKKRPRVAKVAGKARAQSPSFPSTFVAPASPPSMHHAPPPAGYAAPAPVPGPSALPVPLAATQDELGFFDRVRRSLDTREAYDDLLRLLGLFARDVIDARALVRRVEPFLAGELFATFKAMLGWDDGLGSVERGPPGSIRTGPADMVPPPRPEDESMGPSYRRLPESVRDSCHVWTRACAEKEVCRNNGWRARGATSSHARCSTTSGCRTRRGSPRSRTLSRTRRTRTRR